jgi:hypothetical protein
VICGHISFGMDFITIFLGPPLPQRRLSACKFAITNRHSPQAMSRKSWPPRNGRTMTAAPRRETTNYFKLPTWADDNHVHTVVETPRGSRVMPIPKRDLGAWPALHRRVVSLQRDQEVADAGNPLDQVLAGRLVPAVNGVGVVSHTGDPVRLDSGQGKGYIFAMPSRRTSKKDSPAKLASRMKRRWRIVLMRKTGQVLGAVEVIQFELDEFQRRRLLVQEQAR